MSATKTCCKCKCTKDIDQFWKKSKSWDGLQDHCKNCQRELQKARSQTPAFKESLARYRSENPEKIKESTRKWAANNPEKATKWAKENAEKIPSIQLKAKKRQREKLGDSYVRSTIARGIFSHTLIPTELVELKRQVLVNKRLLRTKK